MKDTNTNPHTTSSEGFIVLCLCCYAACAMSLLGCFSSKTRTSLKTQMLLMPRSHCKLNQLELNQVFELGLLIGQSNEASHLIGWNLNWFK